MELIFRPEASDAIQSGTQRGALQDGWPMLIIIFPMNVAMLGTPHAQTQAQIILVAHVVRTPIESIVYSTSYIPKYLSFLTNLYIPQLYLALKMKHGFSFTRWINLQELYISPEYPHFRKGQTLRRNKFGSTESPWLAQPCVVLRGRAVGTVFDACEAVKIAAIQARNSWKNQQEDN